MFNCSSQVLKLNPSLVPFKLAITFDDNASPDCRARLNDVADYLITNLRDYSDISMFPFVPQSPLTINEYAGAYILQIVIYNVHNLMFCPISRSDRLAVQYCIILKEETLTNGVIWLRNRDTRLSVC